MEEFGMVRGHFGPINTVAFHPDGNGFVTGKTCFTVVLDAALLTWTVRPPLYIGSHENKPICLLPLSPHRPPVDGSNVYWI